MSKIHVYFCDFLEQALEKFCYGEAKPTQNLCLTFLQSNLQHQSVIFIYISQIFL